MEATAQVLRYIPRPTDPALLVAVEHFSDAGVYRISEDLALVQTLDFFPPMVDDPFLFGQIAAANSLSDCFCMGASAKTAMNIVGFPDQELGLEVLGSILRGAADKVTEAGAVTLGGHSVRDTEVKFGLSVTGFVNPKFMMTNQNAKAGHVLVLTKALGSGFVSSAHKKGAVSETTIHAATERMRRLNRKASEAAVAAGCRAATDITGFGLAGHGREMADGSGVTLHISLSALPVLPGVKEIIAGGFSSRANASNAKFLAEEVALDSSGHALTPLVFDPQTSGGLLLSLPRAEAESLLPFLHAGGDTDAAIIGEVLPRRGGTAIWVSS